MTGRLAGRTALVTGAARGTGAEVAKLFASEGARVIATDVLDDAGAASGHEYHHLDVTSEDDWQRVVGGLDTLDVLVNNAAVLHLTSIDNTTLEIFERVMRVNATGAFLGTRTSLPLLRRAGHGSIVNIGSIDSVAGVPATVAYTSSKFALRGLTKVTALENGKHGVRCNIVCPLPGTRRCTPRSSGLRSTSPRPRDGVAGSRASRSGARGGRSTSPGRRCSSHPTTRGSAREPSSSSTAERRPANTSTSRGSSRGASTANSARLERVLVLGESDGRTGGIPWR
jgi:3alpha(or 20beta)-hydroxysteroid dehydrogenase